MNEPRLRPKIPVMLGGSGEQKTFRLAALFADHMNIICDKQDIPRKLAALAQRCEEAGRDPGTIETSYLAFVFIAENAAQAEGFLAQVPEDRRARIFAGTAEQVADQLKTGVIDAGIGGLTVNMVVNGHVPGVVTLAGETLRPLVA
jgi:alkanesulfonate monooxygenase SsuD/methylene tetrahydromethanopterin reductase-like flavin-dependent oxidoreductase (luciferase family)